ncbi:MAG: hypothetical protein LRY69_03960 [Gammaproteobacteria bacterium]|nr:hypothetical protein [Gammaproteobacteria bacterium]
MVAFLVYSGFITHSINMSWLFDADTLYLSALYSDIVIKHHSFFFLEIAAGTVIFPGLCFFIFII